MENLLCGLWVKVQIDIIFLFLLHFLAVFFFLNVKTWIGWWITGD